jgi:hypothetical protein
MLARGMTKGYLDDPETSTLTVQQRIECASMLLDRGHGRPAQGVAIVDGTANQTLRDLILASMQQDGPKLIEADENAAEPDELEPEEPDDNLK